MPQKHNDPTKQERPLAAYSLGHILRRRPTLKLLYILSTTSRHANVQVLPFKKHFIERSYFPRWKEILGCSTTDKTYPGKDFFKDLSRIRWSWQFGESSGPHYLREKPGAQLFIGNEVYDEIDSRRFREKGLQLPARTCVQVSAMLADKQTPVEIKSIAGIMSQFPAT